MTTDSLFWQATLAVAVLIVALLFISVVGDMVASWLRQDVRPWFGRRRRQRELGEEAMRLVERKQRSLQSVAEWRRR